MTSINLLDALNYSSPSTETRSTLTKSKKLPLLRQEQIRDGRHPQAIVSSSEKRGVLLSRPFTM